MLTEQQADDYNIALHELEAIEIGQQMAQKKMNEYYSAIEKVSNMMADATPEMMQRVRLVLPKLVEGYNAAKLKLTGYEDRHQQALSRVNEYKALEAQPASRPITRRRIVTPSGYIGGEGWVTKEDGTMVSPDGTTVVTPNGQAIFGYGFEDTLPNTEPETVTPEVTEPETPATNPTSYKDDPLYPEYQEFVNRRNNKNNAYKTDPLYPEFQEFLNWRNNGKPTPDYSKWRSIDYSTYRSTLPEQQNNNKVPSFVPTYGTVFRPNTNRFSLYN